MQKKIAEIILKVYVVDKDGDKRLGTTVEVKGTNFEVMDVAELAQNTGILGEAGVEKVLLCILDEKKLVDLNVDGRVH